VLTKLGGSSKPSIVTSNLPRVAEAEGVVTFGFLYDGETHGRLLDRLTMAPNRFEVIPSAATSRRASAAEPPEGLPPAERAAKDLLDTLERCGATAQARTPAEVRQADVRRIAFRLGVKSDRELDERVAAYDAMRRDITSIVARLVGERRAAGGNEG
jgi:hypothetical protein